MSKDLHRISNREMVSDLPLYSLLIDLSELNKQVDLERTVGLFSGLIDHLTDEPINNLDKKNDLRDKKKEVFLDSNERLSSMKGRVMQLGEIYGINLDLSEKGKFYLKIQDPLKFIEQFSDSEQSVPVSMANHILMQIKESENLFDSEQLLLENLSEIVKFFAAVKSRPLKKLENYAYFYSLGPDELEGYLEVDSYHLWTAQGEGFGPADWVSDSSSEHLFDLWQQAIDVMNNQSLKGHAVVAEKLKDHLIQCLVISSETLEGLSKKGYLQDYVDGLRPVLVKITPLLIGQKNG